jgi:hypothetical protein
LRIPKNKLQSENLKNFIYERIEEAQVAPSLCSSLLQTAQNTFLHANSCCLGRSKARSAVFGALSKNMINYISHKVSCSAIS